VERVSARPRLLVVAPSAELYGSDRALLAALPELADAFSVVLAVPAAGPAADRADALGVSVVQVPDHVLRRRHLGARALGPWLARVRTAGSQLHALHRRDPFALVYGNTLAVPLAGLLARRWRVPGVLHVHECPEPRWLARALLQTARATATAVVCNSAHTRGFVVELVPALASRAVVVHNGLDLPPAPPPPEPGPRLRITCVGRIHPKKGHEVLVEAAAAALAGGADWELHLYGDTLAEHEGLRAGIEQQIRASGLEDRVHWHGFVDDPVRLYAGADVAVVPSVVPEEFSLVALEASALGLPVVVTGPGGAAEVVVDRETGYVVPPRNAAALEGALRALERDPAERRRMGCRGETRARARFSRAAYAAGVLEVCRTAVDGSGRR
jgi:glycosyltransferase involved in cell wall biosynthesis